MSVRSADFRKLLISYTLITLFISTSCNMQNRNLGVNENSPIKGNSTANGPTDPLEIHKRAIAIDLHADTAQRMVDERADISARLSDGHIDAVRMKEGGLDAQFFSIWVEPALYGGG